METGNRELLKVNPKSKVSPEKLDEVWLDLQEYYYEGTNKQSFQKFKRSLKKIIQLENEIISCKAALHMVELGSDEGYEVLQYFKIKATEPDKIKSAIFRKETKLDFAKTAADRKSKKADSHEASTFYKMLASVERSLNRQLNTTEVNLERWVAYLDDIRQKREAEAQVAAKSKGKRRTAKN
ncbi:hypothetical protein [Sunxiuqinia indica]|uniref:hypothetical protein n=1 Tax=Sunxiuqinia indica TaxID=2692584 RepID=UPI00135BFCFC|nr:hypothetical protein [Sunxiuqinia indica]